MKKFRLVTAVFLTLLFTQAFPSTATVEPRPLVVGSFNLEWLGHSNKPRSQNDIYTLARYIKSLEVDVLCFQELHPTGDVTGNGIADWTDLLTALNADEDLYDAKIGTKGGSQRLAQLPQLRGCFCRNLLILHNRPKKVVTTNCSF